MKLNRLLLLQFDLVKKEGLKKRILQEDDDYVQFFFWELLNLKVRQTKHKSIHKEKPTKSSSNESVFSIAPIYEKASPLLNQFLSHVLLIVVTCLPKSFKSAWAIFSSVTYQVGKKLGCLLPFPKEAEGQAKVRYGGWRFKIC